MRLKFGGVAVGSPILDVKLTATKDWVCFFIISHYFFFSWTELSLIDQGGSRGSNVEKGYC